MPAETLRYLLSTMLSSAAKNERNLIVRPESISVTFIQLDDLDREGADRLKPAAFLGLETSPATTRHGFRFQPDKPTRILRAD